LETVVRDRLEWRPPRGDAMLDLDLAEVFADID